MAKNWNFKKLRHGFVNERALTTTTLPFWLRKKRSENTILTLPWIIAKLTEKQITPSETIVNWIFHDIWCCLFIASFWWKIGVFQQRVVRVYYILNWGPFDFGGT